MKCAWALARLRCQRCTIVHRRMDFEWDPKKARLNVRKHEVHFSDALSVLEDENALTVIEESADGKAR